MARCYYRFDGVAGQPEEDIVTLLDDCQATLQHIFQWLERTLILGLFPTGSCYSFYHA